MRAGCLVTRPLRLRELSDHTPMIALNPSGFVYLFFYLNAQLKCMSDHRPAYWKMILTIAPLLGASLIAASLTVDEFHNWVSRL